MRFLVLFLMFSIGCEQFEEQFQTGKDVEYIMECEEGQTTCDPWDEYVWLCKDGWYETYTDCHRLGKECTLYKGEAQCLSDSELDLLNEEPI